MEPKAVVWLHKQIPMSVCSLLTIATCYKIQIIRIIITKYKLVQDIQNIQTREHKKRDLQKYKRLTKINRITGKTHISNGLTWNAFLKEI